MKISKQNILVIGDTHLPFELDGYLEFCKATYKKYRCNKVIHIGDVIDSHASSFHDSDPDGFSAIDEIDLAIEKLKKWYKAFPEMDVCIGNHDRIAARKVFKSGLSKIWLRDLNEVLKVPQWSFRTSFEYNGVLYIHGEGVTARTKVLRTGMSVVQGHRHIEAYVWLHAFEDGAKFGMQVGTGIDNDAYAFAYGKDYPNPVLSCGVVLDNGKTPIIVPMLN